MLKYCIFLGIFCANAFCAPAKNSKNDLFELSIIHLNDFHARFEETSWQSTACKNNSECIGGFSRVYSTVTALLKERPNAIFLNAGDNFQGTLWYTIHKWNATQQFLNMLPTDATTLGNHEFDDKIQGVVPFIKAIKAPMVVANMDVSGEPSMEGLFTKSTIITRLGKKIGVVGVVSTEYPILSQTQNLTFSDETESVLKESKRLKEKENCDIVIVLSHCGLETDRKIAKDGGPNIDVIVGGHSHTFLYTGDNPPGPDQPLDTYPVVVEQNTGRKVLIVQASCYTKYLGNLTVWFDDAGEVAAWEGNPIFMSNQIPQDPIINELLLPWKEEVDKIGSSVLGTTNVMLEQSTCAYKECTLGNFVTDAFVYAWVNKSEPKSWGYVQAAISNYGAFRSGIEKGNITYGDLLTAQPFGNTVDSVELRGDHLFDIFEYAIGFVYKTFSNISPYRILQISGFRLTFNTTAPTGSKVQELKIRCLECDIPVYEPVVLDRWYRVAVPSYLGNGGDGYPIAENMRNRIIGPVDFEVLTDYIAQQSPIIIGEEGRINFVK